MTMTKKHVLAVAAAGALMLGATSLSAAPMQSQGTALKAAAPDSVTQVNSRKHRASRHQAMRVRNWNAARAQDWHQSWGPFGLPFAAAAGVGTATGALVGGTAAALTGYPYMYGPPAYGSYAYAPRGAFGSFGLQPDIGHSYYNGFGATAPASQDNCAVDGGYGRLDYGVAC